MNIILMGPPGAGKGTQAELITAEYNIPHISTGDIFREAVSKGTELGKEAKKYMNEGKLVPDEVTIGIIEERLNYSDCLQGFLLDGFPRTTVQAEALDEVMAKLDRKIEVVINIFVDRDILIERMEGRVSCKNCKSIYNTKFNPPSSPGICDKCGGELVQRSDDRGETVRTRLDVYIEQTSPLLAYYEKKGLLHNINGDQDTSLVFEDIKKVLESLR
ncbi:MAG: adenylate kinase [Syntrophomonadaceae bacterium]|nr:adenylate kinase [Syntrophomonadaceae bacterium]